MAFDDFKLGRLFPTREGGAIGTGSERVMLEATDGAGNIKKRFQNNPDGSVTMLQTRNGWPEFTTSAVTNDAAVNYYLESGQLSIGSFGTSNPERFDAGLWDALLLPDAAYGRWIAWADAAGEQHNTPSIADSQLSKSLGGAADNEQYYNKKLCIQNVPPSMFTGRTRLFVQAQYGSRFSGTWDFTAAIAEQPTLVHNSGVTIDSSAIMTTVVYFDEIDNSYFLISVSSTITIRSIVLPSWAKTLREQITTSGWTEAEKHRAEAYVLGYATISGDSFPVAGETLPNRPIAYGWKSNWKGDKLDMVNVTEEHIGPLPADYKFISNHYRVTLNRDTTTSPIEIDRWSYTLELIEGPIDWVALFGISNVWVPLYAQYNYLLRRYEGDVTTKTFNFTNAPIYCFYDSSDELVVVRYSNTMITLPAGGTHNYTGRTGGLPTGWIPADLVYRGYGPEITGVTETYTGRTSQEVSASFGATVHCMQESTTGRELETLTITAPTFYLHVFGVRDPGVDSPDYAIYTAAASAGGDTNVMYAPFSMVKQTGGSITAGASCALVVPFYDCEAFYASTLETKIEHFGTKYEDLIDAKEVGFEYYSTGGRAYELTSLSGSYGGATISFPSDIVFPNTESNIGVNKHGGLSVTTPLYSSLHDSSAYYPFSSAIHSTYTSAFGATCGIDIAPSPESADLKKTFVGGV